MEDGVQTLAKGILSILTDEEIDLTDGYIAKVQKQFKECLEESIRIQSD